MPIEIILTNEIFGVILIFLGLLILISFKWGFRRGRRRKFLEENEGEAAVRRSLSYYSAASTAHVLNNVTLKYEDGTTQIDHILVTQNGILVIETKHYSGWIFANGQQRQWTQVIYRIKHKFQNPIVQNAKHVNAVRKLLGFIPEEQIQGVVVFTGNAEFKTEMPLGVIQLSELSSYIDRVRLGNISENRVQFCVGRLECERFDITERTDVEHQRYLERKFGALNEVE